MDKPFYASAGKVFPAKGPAVAKVIIKNGLSADEYRADEYRAACEFAAHIAEALNAMELK